MTNARTLRIRPVAEDDFDTWAALWQGYLAFYETAVHPEMYRISFARLLSVEHDTYHGRLAILGDQPVGLVHFLYHAHMWRREPVCYLQDLYASPDVRGQGVGRALIEAVYAEADAAGAPSVYWLTQDFNTTARRLYDRIGAVTPFIKYQRPA